MERKRYNDLIRDVADQVEEVFPWNLLDEMADGSDPLLLDIRCPHEYEAAHIAGSLNVLRGILELACDYGFEETVPELVEARNRRIVVICRSGNRSILAAHTLQRTGFRSLVSLKTGLRGWNDYEQTLQDSEERKLTLDEADDYFLTRLTPAQLGPQAGHEGLAS